MKKVIFILFALIVICGCSKKGSSVEILDSKDDFKVEFLFEVDNVRVYRFVDGGRSIYFTNANGRVEYTHVVHNGKTTTTHKIQAICNNSKN